MRNSIKLQEFIDAEVAKGNKVNQSNKGYLSILNTTTQREEIVPLVLVMGQFELYKI